MIYIFLLISLVVGGCTPTVKKIALKKDSRNIVIVQKGKFLFTEEEKAFIRFEAKKLGIKIPQKSDIKEELRFLLRNKRGLEIALRRASLYMRYITPVLREMELPEELALLPLIESMFNPFAVSRSGAGGIWQLMPATARRYGLRVNNYVDERFDLLKSTRAASAYLKDLHKRFGNWELVLAAYNCGEGCVIKKTGGKDFWSRKDRLPRQTRRFVPRFFAALLIARNPQKYGLAVNGLSMKIRKEFVESPSRVKDLVRRESIRETTFRDLNPHIKGDVIPAKTYVYLPLRERPSIRVVSNAVPKKPEVVEIKREVVRKRVKRKRIVIGRTVKKSRKVKRDNTLKRVGTVIKMDRTGSVIVLDNGAMVYIKE